MTSAPAPVNGYGALGRYWSFGALDERAFAVPLVSGLGCSPVIAERALATVPDREAVLVEELTFLVDELFCTVYQPSQRKWKPDNCPWCRRAAETGMGGPCPLCHQVRRSKREKTDDA